MFEKYSKFLLINIIKIILLIYKYFFIRDAEDAVHARDGYDYDGYRLRVEFPRGNGPHRGGGSGSGGGSYSRGGASGGSGRSRGPPARRSQYRVLVTGKYRFFFAY